MKDRPTLSDRDDTPKVEFFYADPVDADGNVIAHVGPLKAQTPWGEVVGVKVPHDEIVLDPETTIHAKVPEKEDDDD